MDLKERLWRKYLEKNQVQERKICPICDYIGHLEPAAEGKERSICPKCGSNPRSRLYYTYLLEKDIFTKNIKVIGVSPDKPVRSKLLSAREHVDYTVVGKDDLLELQFEDASVDLLMANYIIDRIEDKDKVFDEIKRVLRDDGEAMLSVFFKEEGSDRIDHYSESEYIQLLDSYGLDAKVISAEDVCGGRMEAFVFGIGLNDKIVMTRKRE